MTAPIYGPWIAHNATPDSTCPPDAVGREGEVDCLGEFGSFRRVRVKDLADGFYWASCDVLRYRVLIEPVRGEIVLTGDNHPQCGLTFGPAPLASDTHTLRLPTLDGALIPGEYIGPDGAVIVVGVV